VPLSIVKYPHPILRKKTALVDPKDPKLPKLVDEMFAAMYSAEGVGLAANQVGLDLRLTVIDCSAGEDPEAKLVLINPEIIELKGEVEEEEGCLSFPGIRAKAKRAEWARAKAQDLKGRHFEVAGDGLLGKALQHEIDHLEGKIFVDRLSLVQRALIAGRLKELKAEFKLKGQA